MIKRTSALALAATITLSGCGGDAGPELSARCGSVELPVSGQPVLPDRPLTPDAREAIASVHRVAPGEASSFDEYRWVVAAQGDDSLTLFGELLLIPQPGAPRYADAAFSRVEGEWRPDGWGQCRIEIEAEGYGNAHWIFDRDVQPDPESTALEIEIMEQACASGRAPIDREILPVIIEAADAVSITIFVEPSEAFDVTCPSNPWHPVVVTLDAPLGDRTVFDGVSIPPLERTWPPSQSSADSGGRQP
ncbi:MAG TPA: hypothetical protein VIW46_08020 [Acidimicrobiia bacterium]